MPKKSSDADTIDQEDGALLRETDNPANDIPIDDEHAKANGHANGKSFTIFSKADFVKGFYPPSYLIDGMLQRRFIYAITGATGHAKTAIALLLAELVCSPDQNATLLKHRVRKGRVVYFVGENPDDVRMRIIGADSRRPAAEALLDKIAFIPGIFDIDKLFDKLQTEIEQLGPIDLAIVDTSAAYFLGNEELSNTQMGSHARMLRRLTTLPGGPCVLVLCHPIKHAADPSQLLPRGGGAFLAEMDGNLTSWKAGDTITLHHTKIRGPGFEPIAFKLDRITTSALVDADKRPLPTVRAIAIDDAEEETAAQKTRSDEDVVITTMLRMPDLSVAKIALENNWVSEHGEPQKSRVHRVLEALAHKPKPGLTEKNRARWGLTEKGKVQARALALHPATPAVASNTPEPAKKPRFEDKGKAPAGSSCRQCFSADDHVRTIKRTDPPGEKTIELHVRCADAFFDREDQAQMF